jgi:hypothetical protein
MNDATNVYRCGGDRRVLPRQMKFMPFQLEVSPNQLFRGQPPQSGRQRNGEQRIFALLALDIHLSSMGFKDIVAQR